MDQVELRPDVAAMKKRMEERRRQQGQLCQCCDEGGHYLLMYFPERGYGVCTSCYDGITLYMAEHDREAFERAMGAYRASLPSGEEV